jgi:hypothetical protein
METLSEILSEIPISSSREKICRICLGEEGGIVALRCSCNAYAHNECMIKWINVRRQIYGENVASRCEVCTQLQPVDLCSTAARGGVVRTIIQHRAVFVVCRFIIDLRNIWLSCLAVVAMLTASLAGFAVINSTTLWLNYSITPIMSAVSIVIMGFFDSMLVIIIVNRSLPMRQAARACLSALCCILFISHLIIVVVCIQFLSHFSDDFACCAFTFCCNDATIKCNAGINNNTISSNGGGSGLWGENCPPYTPTAAAVPYNTVCQIIYAAATSCKVKFETYRGDLVALEPTIMYGKTLAISLATAHAILTAASLYRITRQL